MKSLLEKMGDTYSIQEDYLLPNLTLPEQDKPHWNLGRAAQKVPE